MARPKKYTKKLCQEEIIPKMEKYTDENAVPILAEFCYMNNYRRAMMYEQPALSYALKRMTAKKEAQLEKGALSGNLNPSMAIFSLKQLGWKDKQEIDANIKGGVVIAYAPESAEDL